MVNNPSLWSWAVSGFFNANLVSSLKSIWKVWNKWLWNFYKRIMWRSTQRGVQTNNGKEDPNRNCREKCETQLDRKTCNVTYIGVPAQQCSPSTSKRCELDYNVVEEKIYKEECKVNIQHICEEHITGPVSNPVKDPEPKHPQTHLAPETKKSDQQILYTNRPSIIPTLPAYLAYQPSVLRTRQLVPKANKSCRWVKGCSARDSETCCIQRHE